MADGCVGVEVEWAWANRNVANSPPPILADICTCGQTGRRVEGRGKGERRVNSSYPFVRLGVLLELLNDLVACMCLVLELGYLQQQSPRNGAHMCSCTT